MSVLDKKILIADLKARLDDYIPANTAGRIVSDLGELLTAYEVTALKPDGGGDDITENVQLLRMYLDALEIEGKAKSTLARYEYVLKCLFDGMGVTVRKTTVYHLRQFIMQEKARGISMNTIKSYAYIYSGFYGWLHKEGLIEKDPTANLGTIKAKVEEKIPFTSEEIQLIKEACENDYQRAIVHFLLATGCRISELCSVNRKDIDWKQMRLTVTGKGDKDRTLYFDDVAALMLQRYLKTRDDIDPALFYNRNGNRATPHGIRCMLKAIEERSHVPDIHPHRFRHTFATMLIDRGVPIQEVAAMLGHSKLDTTMTYVYLNQRNTENSYRRFATM